MNTTQKRINARLSFTSRASLRNIGKFSSIPQRYRIFSLRAPLPKALILRYQIRSSETHLTIDQVYGFNQFAGFIYFRNTLL